MVTKRDRDKRFFLSSVCFKQRELNKGEQKIRINYSWDHSVVKRQSIKVDWNLIVFVERFIRKTGLLFSTLVLPPIPCPIGNFIVFLITENICYVSRRNLAVHPK